MPKQKASPSFADDLAQVMAPQGPRQRTFADDLADVMGGLQPLDLAQVGAEFGPLAQEVVGAQRPITPWSPTAPPPPLTPPGMPMASDLEQTPAYATTALPQPTSTFAEDLAQVQAPPKPAGVTARPTVPGNIVLTGRPTVQTPEGPATVRSKSWEIDGREVLLPTVADGRPLSDEEALARYKRTGEHLGIFSTKEEATAYGSKLHQEYEAGKYAPLRFNPKTGEVIEPESSTYSPGDFLKDWGITTANAFLAIPETVIGLQSLSSFGLAGKGYDQIGFKPTEWKSYLTQFYSEDRKAKLKYVGDAKTMLDTAVRALQNFSVIAHAVVESLPLMWMGGKAGRGAMFMGEKLAAQGGRMASTKIGSRLLALLQQPAVAGGVGEGIVTAGQQAEQVRQATPGGWLSPRQVALTATAGTLTGTIGAVSGRLAQALGIADVNTMLAGGLLNPRARQNLARALVLGGIQEGNEEFWQSAQEQIMQNLATGKDPWEGVGEQAVLGALAGIVMSGGGQIVQQVKDTALRNRIDVAATQLEQTLGQPPAEKPTVTRPEWSRQQDIEADADTQLRTAQFVESLLRRGELAPLVANDLELRKAAKLVQGGSSMLPVQIAVLPPGAIVTENHGTVDEEDWTVIRQNTATGPTIFTYGATGEVRELAVRGKAGADLGRLLANIVAGTAVVQRPAEAPPAPPAAPEALTTPAGPEPVPTVPGPVPGEPAAPGAPRPNLTEEEFLAQLQAAMAGEAEGGPVPPTAPTSAPMPPPSTPAVAAPTGAVPPGIPLQITRRMERDLKALGQTDEQIRAMTPAQAWEILQAAPPPTVAPAPAQATPAEPSAADALAKAANALLAAANAMGATPATPSVPAAPPAPTEALPPPVPATPAPPVAVEPPTAAKAPIELLERVKALRARVAKMKRKGMQDLEAIDDLKKAEAELAAFGPAEGGTRAGQPVESDETLRPGVNRPAVGETGGLPQHRPPVRPRRNTKDARAEEAADLDALFTDRLDRARQEGFDGTDEELREKFDARIALARSRVEAVGEIESEHGPVALLHAISQAGGIGLDPAHEEYGEVLWFWGKEGKGKPKGASLEFRGIRRVLINGHDTGPEAFRTWGLSLDHMAENLRQDSRFSNLVGPNELIVALADAINPNRKNARQGVNGLFDNSGMQNDRWWADDDGDLVIPPADAPPTTDWTGMVDEAFRPVYEAALALTPDDSWLPEDVQQRKAVIAEGKRRGMTPLDRVEPEPVVDQIPAGAQPRLPGDVGAVRDQNIKTPEFEAPFSLGAEAEKPAKTQTPSMFGETPPTAQEQIDAIRANRDALMKELGKKFNQANVGFDPEIGKLTFQVLTTYVKEGVVRFRDVVSRMVKDYGDAQTRILAPYIDKAWKILRGETVNTLETLAAKQAPTPPATPLGHTTKGTSALITPNAVDTLKAFGLTSSVEPDGSILITGRTYDWKEAIKQFGGQATRLGGIWYWSVTPDGFRGLVDHLAKLPRPKRRAGAPRAHYIGHPRLARLRSDADRRHDESGLDSDPGTALSPETLGLINKGLKLKIPQFVLDEQIEDIYRIVSAYDKSKPGPNRKPLFVLASDPGSGKTFVLGGAIREMMALGAKSITYVTMNKGLIEKTKKDLAGWGIDNVNFITYAGMRTLEAQPTDVFILDEAHTAKNIEGDIATATAAREWIKAAGDGGFTIFSSATPFENPVEAQYLAPTGIFKAEFGDFDSFAFAFGATAQNAGTKKEQALYPTWGTTQTNEEDAASARAWFIKNGVFTSRKLRLPENMVDSRLVKIQADDEGALVYDAIAHAAEKNETTIAGKSKAWVVNFQKRLLEAGKIQQAIKEAEAALKRGRYPIIFVETKAERRYDIPDLVRREAKWKADAAIARRMGGEAPDRKAKEYRLPPMGIVGMLETFMQDTGRPEINIPPAEIIIQDYFGRDRVAVYTGSVGERAEGNLQRWRDSPTPMVLLATMAKGGTGLSLHDTVGNHQTTQINVNMPWSATKVTQVALRSARLGLAGRAEIQWLFADNIIFDRALAARVGRRMSDMGAVVHGAPPSQAGDVEDWNIEDLPFSEQIKLGRLAETESPETYEELESAAFTAAPGQARPRPAKAPAGPGVPPQALFGLPAITPDGNNIVRIPLPEAVELAEQLMGPGKIKIVRKFRSAGTVGSFNPNPAAYGVKLRADLFQKGREIELASALLHEMGHMTDWFPDMVIKRGNLLGRILTLRKFLRHSFTRPDGTQIQVADIRDELKDLSNTWRPWDRSKASDSFIKYRDSAEELYADALSALYNSPGLVKQIAPTFFREFFEYLDRKPDVKLAYFELQARLIGNPERILEHYQARAEQMMDVGNTKAVDLQRQRIELAKLSAKDWSMQLRAMLVDVDVPVQDRIAALRRQGVTITPGENPVYKLEERRQTPAKEKRFVEMYAQPAYEGAQALGLDHAQFGTVFMYERIALSPPGDRGDLANPLGTDPERALAAYDRLKRIWGPDKTREVKQLIDLFRQGMSEVAEDAYTLADMYTPKLMATIRANPAYATFQVVEHMAENLNAEIYHQIGTFKDINNAFDSTVAKALVTIRATADLAARNGLREFLLQHGADALEPAKSVRDSHGRQRFLPPTAEARLRGHSALVMSKQGGKWVGHYADPWIAHSWNHDSADRKNILLRLLRFFNGHLFRPLFITYNVGFQAYNLFRDFYRFWKNIPSMTIGRSFKRYIQAAGTAKVRAFGLSANPTARDLAAQAFIHEAERAGILGITYNELHDEASLSDQNIENLLSAAHVPGYGPKRVHHPVIKQFVAFLNLIKHTGDFIESLPKVAGIIEYKGTGSIADIPPDVRSMIRRKVGSPDFTTSSLYKPITNEVFLFSNAIIQAVRADYEVMTEPTTRTGFWAKTVMANLFPKMLMFAAAAGLMGDTLRRMFAAISEYKKTNYITIPLWEDDKGNVTTFQLPQDDTGRLFSGLLWKGLQMFRGRTDLMETVQQLADYSSGQLPSVTPIGGFIQDVGTYGLGRNPYDFFRGRNVLTDQEQAARGLPALKKFVGWEFQQIGGNILYKFYNGEPSPRQQTWGQRVVNLPVVGNFVGRFVTVGQQGRSEDVRAAVRAEGAKGARLGLSEKDAVFNLLRDRAKGGQIHGNAEALASQLARQLYPDDPTLRRDRQDNIQARIQMGLKRVGGDAYTDAVLTAPSVAQKAAALHEARRQMNPAKFPTWLAHARSSGIVSDDVYAAYRRTLTH